MPEAARTLAAPQHQPAGKVATRQLRCASRSGPRQRRHHRLHRRRHQHVAHDRFRIENEDGSFASRVDFAWIQDGEAVAAKRKPAFGREWLRQEIEEAINASNGDEETVLTRLQLVDFTSPGSRSLARRLTHGTGVLDIATGTASGDGAADAVNQRIVSVQLPALVTMETSGALLNLFLLAGLHYILERARLISKHVSPAAPLPVIINFSFGIAGGPHDGRHFIERAFQALIEDHKDSKFGGDVHVVIPSGNLFLTRGHAAATSSTSSSANGCAASLAGAAGRSHVQLPRESGYPTAPPLRRTSKYLSYARPASRKPVNVLTGGNVSQPMILAGPGVPEPPSRRLSVDRPVEPGRWRVLLALAATASTESSVGRRAIRRLAGDIASATIPQGQHGERLDTARQRPGRLHDAGTPILVRRCRL
jgi:hypothetical protein